VTEYLLVAAAALAASALTLFSGFGLGTLLMPVLALMFPVPVAIAATAIVHFANNLFKLAIVGRHADWRVVRTFGIAAGIAAVAGAVSLGMLADMPPVARYVLFGTTFQIEAIKLVIGLLIVLFAAIELTPRFERLSFPPEYLVPGGLLSGFFGGLSGNQGALRSAFLIRAGLDKYAYVGTSVVCGSIVDFLRILVYGSAYLVVDSGQWPEGIGSLVGVAILAAFSGAYIGIRLLDKVTFRFLQLVVGALMILVGIALASSVL